MRFLRVGRFWIMDSGQKGNWGGVFTMPDKVSHIFYSLMGTAVFHITRLCQLGYTVCCFWRIMPFYFNTAQQAQSYLMDNSCISEIMSCWVLYIILHSFTSLNFLLLLYTLWVTVKNVMYCAGLGCNNATTLIRSTIKFKFLILLHHPKVD